MTPNNLVNSIDDRCDPFYIVDVVLFGKYIPSTILVGEQFCIVRNQHLEEGGFLMEKTITLRKEGDQLRCPHCGGGGLSVKHIQICHPSDGMLVTFGTDPLCLDDIDGGGGEGYVWLTVDCPHCSPQGDRFFLQIADGKTRVRDFVARAHWSTDRAGDPNSVSNRMLKAFADAGENGLTSAELAAIINNK